MPDNEETRIEDLLNSEQAVEYLAKKWKLETYSKGAFRALRFRLNHDKDWNIEPALSTRTAAFWRKVDLDRIPKPDRTRTRGPRKKNDDSINVMLIRKQLTGVA